MSDIVERHVMSAAEFAIEDAFAANPFKGLPRKEVVAHAVQIERDWYEAEITRLRAQVAEQEATIRRLQDRASKDAETFIERVREAVESRIKAAEEASVTVPLGVGFADGAQMARFQILQAIRTAEGERR